MKTLAKWADLVYFRFVDAWRALTGKETFNQRYEEGVADGILIANDRVIQKLNTFDPHNFSNNHFKLGYYYASEQVKKEM